MIGAQLEDEKKVEKPKDNAATLVPSPTSSPIPSIIPPLLLPRIPHVKVVDLRDVGSSDGESTESDEATKKTIEIEKG